MAEEGVAEDKVQESEDEAAEGVREDQVAENQVQESEDEAAKGVKEDQVQESEDEAAEGVKKDQVAENQVQESEDEGEEEQETVAKSPPPKRQVVKVKECKLKCNERIDELATPYRRMFLALWNEHAHHFPEEKVEHLKELLKRLYAMSPEETAKYFEEIRNRQKSAAIRRKIKEKLRHFLQQNHKQKQRERAYKLFKKLLKCGITYAAENPVPPLVSLRLRYLSDIILEQLCDLRCLEMPHRSNPDQLGAFLISVADWIAIAIERLYFAADVSMNQAVMFPELHVQSKSDDISFTQPQATSSPRGSKDIQNKKDLWEGPEKNLPYYNFVEPGKKQTKKRVSLSPMPFYSFRGAKPPSPDTAKSLVEIPFYKYKDNETIQSNKPTKKQKKINKFIKKQQKNLKCPKC